MATTSINFSDALDAKIKDPVVGWGSVANWKAWVRASTKADIFNTAVNDANISAMELVEAARKAAESQDATL